MIEVDGKTPERGRHELRRAEGAGPGADQPVGPNVAVLENLQRGKKLVAKIALPASDAGKRCGGADHRAAPALRAVSCFHAPDRGDGVAVDAERALDGVEGRAILVDERPPLRDTVLGDQNVEIVPERLGELG